MNITFYKSINDITIILDITSFEILFETELSYMVKLNREYVSWMIDTVMDIISRSYS